MPKIVVQADTDGVTVTDKHASGAQAAPGLALLEGELI